MAAVWTLGSKLESALLRPSTYSFGGVPLGHTLLSLTAKMRLSARRVGNHCVPPANENVAENVPLVRIGYHWAGSMGWIFNVLPICARLAFKISANCTSSGKLLGVSIVNWTPLAYPASVNSRLALSRS